MKSLALDINDAAAVFGAIEEGWAVRTLDGGASWDQIEEGMDHDAHYVTVMPDTSNVVIVTGGKGVYRSADRGGLEGYRYTPAYVVVRPERPRELLTTVTRTGPGGWMKPEPPGVAFARSADQGETWQILPNAVSADFHPVPRGLVADPEAADVCFAGMIDGSIWMSSENGEHFEQIVGGLPPVSSLAVGRR
jgi:photosystem II stability/assembly factor-like uncharacterized protein